MYKNNCLVFSVYDMDDACSGAQHLADTGKVDGQKLCIDRVQLGI